MFQTTNQLSTREAFDSPHRSIQCQVDMWVSSLEHRCNFHQITIKQESFQIHDSGFKSQTVCFFILPIASSPLQILALDALVSSNIPIGLMPNTLATIKYDSFALFRCGYAL